MIVIHIHLEELLDCLLRNGYQERRLRCQRPVDCEGVERRGEHEREVSRQELSHLKKAEVRGPEPEQCRGWVKRRAHWLRQRGRRHFLGQSGPRFFLTNTTIILFRHYYFGVFFFVII